MMREILQQPNIPEESKENLVERKEQRIDKIMEARHKNALEALKIEKILSEEIESDEYPTTITPENITIIEKVEERLKSLDFGLIEEIEKNKNIDIDTLKEMAPTEKRKALKLEIFKNVISNYLCKKVKAQRAERTLKEIIEEKGEELSEKSLGKYLFENQTSSKSHSAVVAKRREGYFIISFADTKDYYQFKMGKEKAEEGESSGGHYDSWIPVNGVCGGIEIIAINRLQNLEEETGTLIHERQHFINNTFFHFSTIEPSKYSSKDYPILNKAVKKELEESKLPLKEKWDLDSGDETEIKMPLARTKNEFLAYLRDPTEDFMMTHFIDKSLYSDIRESFSQEEQEELDRLMEDIEENLSILSRLLTTNKERAVLVYHLIDIPLIKIPQRLKALENYLSKQDEYKNKYESVKEKLEIKKWILEKMDELYSFEPDELTDEEKKRNKKIPDKL